VGYAAVILAVRVSDPDGTNNYSCDLIAFGGVVCGRCDRVLPQPVELGVTCCECGAVVTTVDRSDSEKRLAV
jgi:hypothetical protein